MIFLWFAVKRIDLLAWFVWAKGGVEGFGSGVVYSRAELIQLSGQSCHGLTFKTPENKICQMIETYHSHCFNLAGNRKDRGRQFDRVRPGGVVPRLTPTLTSIWPVLRLTQKLIFPASRSRIRSFWPKLRLLLPPLFHSYHSHGEPPRVVQAGSQPPPGPIIMPDIRGRLDTMCVVVTSRRGRRPNA